MCRVPGAILHKDRVIFLPKVYDLKPSDRVYHCYVCGFTMDRDLNAAINIRNMGLIKVGQGMSEFTPVESATAAELLKGGLRVATL